MHIFLQIIIATPARLNDIIDNHPSDIDLADIEALVLDEVDCLLQMGFGAQVKRAVMYKRITSLHSTID